MAVPLLRAEHDVLGEAVAMHGLVRELGGMVGWNSEADGEANDGEAYSECIGEITLVKGIPIGINESIVNLCIDNWFIVVSG